jgi:hypothetical protein
MLPSVLGVKMPVALFITGMIWALGALALVLGCTVARTQPTMYAFLDADRFEWFYPGTYYTFVALLLSAATPGMRAQSRLRRQHNSPVQWTGAARAFPVIPSADDSGPGH